MELRHLRYFRAVAEELHFGRAAARLNMAQPPLSQQIRQLEQELGAELFNRSTRKVELTPAGAAYLDRVGAILDAVEDAGGQARRIAAGVEGHLAIGCVGSATYSLLPQFVRALADELPGVEVSVRGEMLAPYQVVALVNGEIDIALLRPPVDHSRIVVETIRRDPLIVALPDKHRLTQRDSLRVAELRDEDFIAHAGSGRSIMNNLLTAACAEAGFIPRIRHEVEETSTLLTLVAAGLGVAIVPAPTSALGLPGVAYRPLAPPEVSVALAVARLSDSDNAVIDTALAILRRICARD